MFAQRTFGLLAACLLVAVASRADAQGTASAPSTFHVIDDTNTVFMGGPNDPFNGPDPQPIDLDPLGLPWRKGLVAGSNGFAGGTIRIIENIENVGTEPWGDWHEIDAHIGTHGTVWGSVIDVQVNGSSIGFDSTIAGSNVDLFNFSQPVLPGDTLQIFKTLEAVTDNVAPPGALVASVLQYPTIPEPSSVILLAGCLAGGGLWLRSRHRQSRSSLRERVAKA